MVSRIVVRLSTMRREEDCEGGMTAQLCQPSSVRVSAATSPKNIHIMFANVINCLMLDAKRYLGKRKKKKTMKRKKARRKKKKK